MSFMSMSEDEMDAGRFHSLLLSAFVSVLYPASLYIWPNAVNSNRHDPKTIKRNFVSVFLVLLFSLKALELFKGLTVPSSRANASFLTYLTYREYANAWDYILHCIVLPLNYAVILFLGSIYAECSDWFNSTHCDNVIKSKSVGKSVVDWLRRADATCWLILVRNLVVAPLTEEVIFRGVVLSMLVPSWSRLSAVVLSSSLFGLVHLHHFVRESWLSRSINSGQLAVAVFQCLYTSFFGLYAALAYFTSGNLITPIILHIFCNINGFPDFSLIYSNKVYLLLTLVSFCIWLYYFVNLFFAL